MLEMIVFALVLVTAQFIGGFITMKYMMKKYMNKQYIKETTKMMLDVTQELQEEMEDAF